MFLQWTAAYQANAAGRPVSVEFIEANEQKYTRISFFFFA